MFIILGLENGYKQLPVHPSDLQTQMYSLGPNEFYIDVSIPYGRADSARVFSRWISLVQFVKISFWKPLLIPISLSVYMDKFFGGPFHSESLVKDLKNA